ncbi:MAG: rRNA maturation RNase YbeY [Candidatus Chisholmbacteria bacterium]|nr:rRNA maturation RNase YbeY [Candidatus Chisholmbacteria bacterium]
MVKIVIRAEARFPVNRDRVRGAVGKVVDEYGVKEAVVNVIVVGKRQMAKLNRQWLGREGATDVLSFPLEDVESRESSQAGFVYPPDLPLMLGDVVVCWPEAIKQAAERNVLVDDEVAMLVEHGLRHLLGEHHD